MAVAYYLLEDTQQEIQFTTFPPDVAIEDETINLLPQSVTRESSVFPLGYSTDELVVAASDPLSQETFDKIRFILNRKVAFVYTSSDWIDRQNDRYYGPN